MEQTQILITEDAFLIYDTPTYPIEQDFTDDIDVKAEDLFQTKYAPTELESLQPETPPVIPQDLTDTLHIKVEDLFQDNYTLTEVESKESSPSPAPSSSFQQSESAQ